MEEELDLILLKEEVEEEIEETEILAIEIKGMEILVIEIKEMEIEILVVIEIKEMEIEILVVKVMENLMEIEITLEIKAQLLL